MSSSNPNGHKSRIHSIDTLRGLVMVIMVLDHVREYLGTEACQLNSFPGATNTAFFTRLFTHLCAPTFVFLAGVSIGLALKRGQTLGGMSKFLLSRGAWLVIVDMTIIHAGWSFLMNDNPIEMGVIWAIGASMLLVACVIHLPRKVLWVLSLATLSLHNLVDPVDTQLTQDLGFFWSIVHSGGVGTVAGFRFDILYPVVPWVSLMLLGYLVSSWYDKPSGPRIRLLMTTGGGALFLFIILRAASGYGDAHRFIAAGSLDQMAQSFFDLTKYPPSLHFLLLTVGLGLLLLALFENPMRGRISGQIRELLCTYGRVPMFFYIVHIYLVHAASEFFLLAHRFSISASQAGQITGVTPSDFGYGGIYVAWFVIVLLMYWPSKIYGRLKRRSKHWVFSYL